VKSVTERLTAVPDDCDPTRPVYLEDNIRAIAPIVMPLVPYHPPSMLDPYRARPPRGLLAVIEDGEHVEFAVFEWQGGPATDVSGAQVEAARFRRVFEGSGPSGALRELRHTTWGEDDAPGYLNSPSAKVIAEAFAQLRRWFDID